MNARRLTLAVLAAFGVSLFSIAPVQADTGLGFQSQFGTEGSGSGQFYAPKGVATDLSSGDVYVVDGYNRVDKFNSTGAFLATWGWNVKGDGGNYEVCTTGSCQAGTEGSGGAGQFRFGGSSGVAVDQTTHDVYVADRNNSRVQKFDSAGGFISMFGLGVDQTPGAANPNICTAASGDACGSGRGGDQAAKGTGLPNGLLTGPSGVAVDSSGGVYVVDASDFDVDKFDSAGVFVSSFGSGVDKNPLAANPNVCTAASGDACGPGTRGSSSGQFNEPSGVAVDSSGNVYVVDMYYASSRVEKFDSSGNFVSLLDNGGLPQAVAVDSSNDVYVAGGQYQKNHVVEYSPSGASVAAFGLGHITWAGGLAVNSSLAQVYVSDLSGNDVSIYEVVSTLPAATTGAASGVTPTSAMVRGLVNPNPNGTGYSATYHFDYGVNIAYGGDGALGGGSTEETSIGEGVVPVDTGLVSIGGLEPNATYHYRLVATTTAGSTYGADETFLTPPAPPSAQLESSNPTPNGGVTLSASVNANNQDTHYYFEYGTGACAPTTCGVNVPAVPADIGSVYGDQTVSVNVSGLEPGTTYDYRAVASNATGTTYGVDQQFTTLPAASVPVTELASSVTTVAAMLNGTVNPAGFDTTYYYEYGTDTTYSLGSVPAQPGNDVGNTGTTATVLPATPLSGLLPNTTYHFRLDSNSVGGQIFGADQMFTTVALAPAVVTGLVTAGSTTATLDGSIVPQGVDTTYHFDYGTDTSYGSVAPVIQQDGGSGTAGEQVTTHISGLTVDTVYHYRLVATNSGGTTYGADQTFTTYATPPSVATLQAQNIGPGTATLTGMLNPQGGPTAYYFQYGPSLYYGTSSGPAVDGGAGSTSQSVAAAISGLAVGVSYHYRLVASNAGGTSYGADQVLTTVPALVQAATPTPTTTPKVAPPPTKTAQPKALTNAQKLSNALKACRKEPTKLRVDCEKQARKKYSTTKKKRKKTNKKGKK